MKPKVRRPEFQPRRLTQARHSQLLSMEDLAARIGVTRQAISSFERGASNPSPDTLRALATNLAVPEAFFTTSLGEAENARNSITTFRTFASSTVKARHQASAYLDWLAHAMSFARTYVEFPPVQLPNFDVSDVANIDNEEIDDLADKTRKLFGLGDGPISNLSLLLENKGVLVAYVPLLSGIDGLSSWYADRPVVMISRHFPAARRRFDLAHELGHLVMHKSITTEEQESKDILKKMERDAHRFAGAFLLPERSFASEVYGYDLESMTRLKSRWGVSIQAMIIRFSDLRIIGEHQKVHLFQRLSAQGMRKREPLDNSMPVEKGIVFQRVFDLLEKNNVMHIDEIASRMRLPEHFVEWATAIPHEKLIGGQPSNVVPLRAKF